MQNDDCTPHFKTSLSRQELAEAEERADRVVRTASHGDAAMIYLEGVRDAIQWVTGTAGDPTERYRREV